MSWFCRCVLCDEEETDLTSRTSFRVSLDVYLDIVKIYSSRNQIKEGSVPHIITK